MVNAGAAGAAGWEYRLFQRHFPSKAMLGRPYWMFSKPSPDPTPRSSLPGSVFSLRRVKQKDWEERGPWNLVLGPTRGSVARQHEAQGPLSFSSPHNLSFPGPSYCPTNITPALNKAGVLLTGVWEAQQERAHSRRAPGDNPQECRGERNCGL